MRFRFRRRKHGSLQGTQSLKQDQEKWEGKGEIEAKQLKSLIGHSLRKSSGAQKAGGAY